MWTWFYVRDCVCVCERYDSICVRKWSMRYIDNKMHRFTLKISKQHSKSRFIFKQTYSFVIDLVMYSAMMWKWNLYWDEGKMNYYGNGKMLREWNLCCFFVVLRKITPRQRITQRISHVWHQSNGITEENNTSHPHIHTQPIPLNRRAARTQIMRTNEKNSSKNSIAFSLGNGI